MGVKYNRAPGRTAILGDIGDVIKVLKKPSCLVSSSIALILMKYKRLPKHLVTKIFTILISQ